MTGLPTREQFPPGFVFGTATSAYQIEGTRHGSCGRSHWDQFAAEPGRTHQGENGFSACDHYLHWAADLDLVKSAGFDAYRFSFSWSRLLPDDAKTLNPEGLSFYDRLIDGMLARELKPFATLHHWDLPVRHAHSGGWRSRDTAEYFGDFTDVIMRHFGDRLHTIAPINEPWCVAWLSHYIGLHAPGLSDIRAAGPAMHHVNLAHARSIAVMRSYGHQNLGAVLNKEYAQPAHDTEASILAAQRYDGIYNRWFEEALFKGRYPDDILQRLEPYLPQGWQADMAAIAAPLDWIGVNYYTRAVVADDPAEPVTGYRCVEGPLPKTAMDWEIYPDGLAFFIERLHRDYCPDLPIYVTENGMANHADIAESGRVQDQARIDYYQRHLERVLKVIDDGTPVHGYLAWSLLDNFEWSFGYQKRFGLVHVDYVSQARTPKDSWYAFQAALTS